MHYDALSRTIPKESCLQTKGGQRETNFIAKLRLRINESKTMVMHVSKCDRIPPQTFKINDVELTNTKTYKYLDLNSIYLK